MKIVNIYNYLDLVPLGVTTSSSSSKKAVQSQVQ